MKEIFDWLREQMNKEILLIPLRNNHGVNFKTVDVADVQNLINEAEAKWEESKAEIREKAKHTYENCHNITCRRKCQKDGYNRAIDEFARRIIELNNEFPTVENDYGEIRPMRIEEMCERISEQMKGEKE